MREVHEKGKYFVETISVVVTVISIIVTVIGIVITAISIHYNTKDNKNKRSNRTDQR